MAELDTVEVPPSLGKQFGRSVLGIVVVTGGLFVLIGPGLIMTTVTTFGIGLAKWAEYLSRTESGWSRILEAIEGVVK